VTISVYSSACRLIWRRKNRQCRSVQSIMGATEIGWVGDVTNSTLKLCKNPLAAPYGARSSGTKPRNEAVHCRQGMIGTVETAFIGEPSIILVL
jgi:hypothetical protein